VRPLLSILAALATLIAGLGLPAATSAATPARVAIIVGPVGEELTPVYLGLAETAAAAAETRGATVARAYSPNATAGAVLAAVEGANIVIYFGHGVGTPSPYSANPASANGWALNGLNAVGSHADSWVDGTLTYYGEAWIAENARPAPGWVMIYSNACYAPGASEEHHDAADEVIAAGRVSAYSRGPLAELGASAYFATDFYEGAAHLVGALLDAPSLPYGDIFASEPRFDPAGLVRLPHAGVTGAEAWLHRSAYFNGKVDYWYAFAGDPTASLAGGGGTEPASARTAELGGTPRPGIAVVDGLVSGIASSYPENAGWEGEATIALPAEIGGGIPSGEPSFVLVCADRCVTLPVVDSCPCYVGSSDQRVANLSHAAWAMVSDAPLSRGLIEVKLHLSPVALPAAPPAS